MVDVLELKHIFPMNNYNTPTPTGLDLWPHPISIHISCDCVDEGELKDNIKLKIPPTMNFEFRESGGVKVTN